MSKVETEEQKLKREWCQRMMRAERQMSAGRKDAPGILLNVLGDMGSLRHIPGVSGAIEALISAEAGFATGNDLVVRRHICRAMEALYPPGDSVGSDKADDDDGDHLEDDDRAEGDDMTKIGEGSLDTFKQGLEAGAALKALEQILDKIEAKAGDLYPGALKTEVGRSVLIAALPVLLEGLSSHAGPAENAVRKVAGLCETAHLAIGVKYGAHLAEIVGSLLEGVAE